mgnify:FL=1
MASHPARLLLFDLGGVVIEFSGPRELVGLVDTPLTEEEIGRRWGTDPHVSAFERGDIDAATFARRFCDHWRLPLTPEAFLVRLRGWSKRWLPGALELLTTLRASHRLACLSNSNPLHWERNLTVHRIQDHFEPCLASHELRALKPEAEIFAAAVARLGVPIDSITFFDDSPANVAGARAAGLDAHQVAGPEGTQRQLQSLGLWPT